jgi:hypothetical protein
MGMNDNKLIEHLDIHLPEEVIKQLSYENAICNNFETKEGTKIIVRLFKSGLYEE